MLFPSVYLTTPPSGPVSVNRKSARRAAPRRAAVLLIVLILLVLFASVGLAFMFYAESESVSSTTFREASQPAAPDVDAEMAFSLFMQQLLFDAPDDAWGVQSALRGHSLLRNLYGLNYTWDPTTGTILLTPNNIPFNGTGRLHWKLGDPGMPAPPVAFSTLPTQPDDYFLVNYQYFPQDGFVRDPERFGIRTSASLFKGSTDNRGPYIGTANPPYTAADLNCMALAAVRGDGNLLTPSFHRTWTGFGTLAPTNPNWYSTNDPTLKYKVMTPRPADHPPKTINGITKPGFSPPDDAGGHVRNRPGKWGGTGNDSIWMYTGAPVYTLPDGRRYTMLFAPMIVDLEGKLNVNAHGNIRGAGNTHMSNQGWGDQTEINLSRLLTALDPVSGGPEWTNLMLGTTQGGGPKQSNRGKYGPQKVPSTGSATNIFVGVNPATGANASTPPHYYARVDYDGTTGWSLTVGGTATGAWTPPSTATPYQLWPVWPAGYENDGNTTAAVAGKPPLPTERLQSPLLYNPTAASTTGATAGNLIFMPHEMDKLYRYGDTGTEAMLSDMWRLIPTNLTNNVKHRNLLTTFSYDRREIGQAPWLYNPATPQRYELLGFAPGGAALRPSAAGLLSPSLALFAAAATRNVGKEFTADWRGNVFNALRIDLNRTLPNYPAINATTFRMAQIQDPKTGQLVLDPTVVAGFQNATVARQQFATDILGVLVKVTGAFDPMLYKSGVTAPPTQGEIDALRWLAQLSVNIVDYIDSDDYITPLNWGRLGSPNFLTDFPALGAEWVYGTELPKVVINEVYCEYSNDLTEPTLQLTPAQKYATFYNVDCWAELCNPFRADTTLRESGDARLGMFPTDPTNPTTGYPIYKLVVTDPTNLTLIHAPGNSKGAPDDITKVKGVVDKEWAQTPGTTDVIHPLNGAFAAPNNQGSNVGFYMVGPPRLFPAVNTGNPAQVPPRATLQAPGMRYKFPIVGAGGAGGTGLPTVAPTLMLQRLLCPHIPPNEDPNNPATPYNPYITVDYFDLAAAGLNAAYIHNGVPGGGDLTPDATIGNRIAFGRRSPYNNSTTAANLPQAQVVFFPTDPDPTKNQAAFPPNQPKHTFFHHNYLAGTTVDANGKTQTTPSAIYPNTTYTGFWWSQDPKTGLWTPPLPVGYPGFPWLVHLDRKLISPMELLHVSGFRPHELTHQFTGAMFQHQAPWFDNTLRLYRFFEYAHTLPRQAGSNATTSTRYPGKININTIWDPEVFLALCDPQTGSHFTAANLINTANPNLATTIWGEMITQRNPATATIGGAVQHIPGVTDQYFMPLSAGVVPANATDLLYPTSQFPRGMGIGNTILRPFAVSAAANGAPTTRRLFEPPVTAVTAPNPPLNPYQRYELLTKIYNNVTVRSNCFAVWVTVGFFEVNDVDSTGRIYLGQEMGRAEGKNIRHRMFGIIDRSALLSNTIATGTAVIPNSGPPLTPTTIAGAGQWTVQAALSGTVAWTGSANTQQWAIQPGMLLRVTSTLASGTAVTDDISVVSVDPVGGTFTANFTKAHGQTLTLAMHHGNPGPNQTFNPHSSTLQALLPYFSVIE
jgi:hypothetical protein